MATSSESFQQLLGRITKRQPVPFNHNILGRLSAGDLVELTGAHISGATSLFCNVALRHLILNPTSNVVYIDCDRGVSPAKFDRLLTAMGHEENADNVLDRLMLSRCNNSNEVKLAISEIEKSFKQDNNYADLVLIDNVLSFYWFNIYDRTALADIVLSSIQKIKDMCAIVVSRHPPIRSSKQLESLIPYFWKKLVTKRMELMNQSNPRYLVDGNSHVQFDIDLGNGLVT